MQLTSMDKKQLIAKIQERIREERLSGQGLREEVVTCCHSISGVLIKKTHKIQSELIRSCSRLNPSSNLIYETFAVQISPSA